MTFFIMTKKNLTLTKSPKYLNLIKKAQHDPKVRLESKAELGYNQNQKANREKFSLSLTVTPARAELGPAQVKLVLVHFNLIISLNWRVTLNLFWVAS